MSRIVISAKDLPAELQRLEGSVREAIHRGIRSAARRGRAELVRRTPKDHGLLKASWRDTATGAGGSTIAEVMNDAPYVGIVEAGARPHAVSEAGQAAIREWVRRHLPDLIGRDRAKTIKRRFANYAEIEINRITSAIVWRIRKYGQPPTYFIRDALPELSRYAALEVLREFQALSKKGRAS